MILLIVIAFLMTAAIIFFVYSLFRRRSTATQSPKKKANGTQSPKKKAHGTQSPKKKVVAVGNGFFLIGDGAGNFLTFDNDNFSLASTSKTGSRFEFIKNGSIMCDGKYLSLNEVSSGYLLMLLNKETAWQITHNSISTTVGGKTYYIGFNREDQPDFEIVTVGLLTSPQNLQISKA